MPTFRSQSKEASKSSDLRASHRDLAFNVIRRSIVLGDTKSGMRINERVMGEKLGISRVPARGSGRQERTVDRRRRRSR